jgi:cysteinyl-tRNA synthetase
MDEDFGTPEAVAVLFDLASEVNRPVRPLAGLLRALGASLGLLQLPPDAFLQALAPARRSRPSTRPRSGS